MSDVAPALLQHPGPRLMPRVQTVTTRSTAVHAELSPGVRLIDGLDEILASTDATCAQVEITGGIFDRISYCVPAECPDGSVVCTFSETREARTPAQLLVGSVTVGFRDGERFMHCHAVWLDAEGQIRAATCGRRPSWAGFRCTRSCIPFPASPPSTRGTRRRACPFSRRTPPRSGSDESGPARGARVAMSRVRPGEDITAAVRRVCVEQGFGMAVVRAGVGSLVGACLRRGHDVVNVDGPATELATIAGRVHGDIADFELSAIVVDRHGEVHGACWSRDATRSPSPSNS